MRVLYAEDDSAVAKSFVELAGLQGITVEHVSNGRYLVEKARIRGYRAIVTDRDMPVMGGIEAIDKIRIFDQSTPIYVFCSPGAGREVETECERRGVKFYAKPSGQRELLEELSRLAQEED